MALAAARDGSSPLCCTTCGTPDTDAILPCISTDRDEENGSSHSVVPTFRVHLDFSDQPQPQLSPRAGACTFVPERQHR